MTEPHQPHPFDHDDTPAPAPEPAETPSPWDEDDALVDVHEAIHGFTREWRERAPSFEKLLRAARYWVHELEQKEERRRAACEPKP
jgi:hypothetical protein